MRMDFVNQSTRLLFIAVILLALIVAAELLYPARPAETEVPTSVDSTVLLPDFGETDFSAPRFEDLANMLDRPIFFSDRKLPEPPAVAAAVAAPLAPLRLKLEGIAMTGESSIAVVRDLNSNQLLQLEEGMTHDGWTLDAVSSNSATFSRGAQTTELKLDPRPGQGRR